MSHSLLSIYRNGSLSPARRVSLANNAQPQSSASVPSCLDRSVTIHHLLDCDACTVCLWSHRAATGLRTVVRTRFIENPYQAPAVADDSSSSSSTKSLRVYIQVNGMLMVLLLLVVAISFLWATISNAWTIAQIGRRYASYDHEISVYPFRMSIILVLLFAFANLGTWLVRRARRTTEI